MTDSGFYDLFCRQIRTLGTDTGEVIRDPVTEVRTFTRNGTELWAHVTTERNELELQVNSTPALPYVGGEVYYVEGTANEGWLSWNMPCLFCAYIVGDDTLH